VVSIIPTQVYWIMSSKFVLVALKQSRYRAAKDFDAGLVSVQQQQQQQQHLNVGKAALSRSNVR